MSSNVNTEPAHSPSNKQARHRLIQACLPCHRQKRRCDKGRPCANCLKRQITRSCVYESIASDDLETLQAPDTSLAQENETLKARIAELEGVVADYKLQVRENVQTSAGTVKRKRTKRDVDNGHEEDKDGVYYGRSYYLGGAAAPAFLQRMLSLVPQEQSDLLFAFSGSTNEASPGPYVFPTLFLANTGMAEMLSLLSNMGKEEADKLLDAYYNLCDPLHHYVPTPWLMQRYERCWQSDEEQVTAQELALIFTILALGDLVCENNRSWLLVAAAMQLLRLSNLFANPSMDTIYTFCYIAVYLQHEGKLGEYWPMLGLVIRLAQSMALHRDPSIVLKLSSEESELRRRLFWTIAAQETALSSMFGRPNGIGFTDCRLPRDVGDDDLFGEATETYATEDSALNEISYNRLTWELSSITRDMLRSASHDVDDRDIPRLQAIESSINNWTKVLPVHFRYNPGLPPPEMFSHPESRARYVQSISLHMIANHNVLVLWRKLLLAGTPNQAIRRSCFESAFAVADSWKVLQDTFPKMARITWMHWFRAFHAALICLVAIRIDGQRSEFRSKALTCWMSCLRIFSRIQQQNQSVMSCFRALSRLDLVVKKEMEAHRGPRRYSNQRRLQDTSSQLLLPAFKGGGSVETAMTVSPEEDLDFSKTPVASTLDGETALPMSAASGSGIRNHYSEILQIAGFSDTGAVPTLDASNMLFPDMLGMDSHGVGYDLFDMDAQNWPAWLTKDTSPSLT